ncbi:RluA family pseudouridine synthase [Bacteroidota bacterium]
MSEQTNNSNYPELIETIFEFDVSPGQLPDRLDVFLTNSIKNATRTKVQKAIDGACVTINGKVAKASKKIQPNDKIICKIMKSPPIKLIPENIPLNVLYEDDDVLIINKNAGIVTHPGYGNRSGTIVNAVLYHLGRRDTITIEFDEDSEVEGDFDEGKVYASDEIRPGIVHRLDKETSGILVIAKDSNLHPILAEQFADRTIERFYYAIVWGDIKNDSGTVTGDIGRNPRNRKLFSVVKKGGKKAKTEYWVLERFGYATLVKIKLHTGRTHQIRVHFSYNKHPLVGDSDYGGDNIVYGGSNPTIKKAAVQCLKTAKRQMLHAKVLGFDHPVSCERMIFESDLPEDFQKVLEVLRKSNDSY